MYICLTSSLTESAYLKSKQINCSINNDVKILETFFATPEIKSKKFQKWRTSYPYPQNLARNIARKGANTAYTMVCPEWTTAHNTNTKAYSKASFYAIIVS